MPLIDSVLAREKIILYKSIILQKAHNKIKKRFNIQVVLANFSRGTNLHDHFYERLIPVKGSHKKYASTIFSLRKSFK